MAEKRDARKAILNFLIGEVMKKSGGAADPKVVKELLLERLETGEDNGN